MTVPCLGICGYEHCERGGHGKVLREFNAGLSRAVHLFNAACRITIAVPRPLDGMHYVTFDFG